MARPTKESANLRTKTMRIRVTAEEEKQILLNARLGRFKSASEYLRHLGLGNRVKPFAMNIDPELLIRIKGELGKIGSNVNQIARAYNRRAEGKITSVTDDDISNAMHSIDTMTRYLLKVLGYGD
jgi:hypothetical protein